MDHKLKDELEKVWEAECALHGMQEPSCVKKMENLHLVKFHLEDYNVFYKNKSSN